MFNFATDFYIFTVTYQKQKTKIYIKNVHYYHRC